MSGDVPGWVKRLRFWLWDGQYDWLFEWGDGWMERHLPSRVADLLCSAQLRVVETPGLWLICRIWGHQPHSECSDPTHDSCLTCQRSMPYSFPRLAVRGGEPNGD